jgi:hypothetical protein
MDVDSEIAKFAVAVAFVGYRRGLSLNPTLTGPERETYTLLKNALDRHMAITDEADAPQGEKRDRLQRGAPKKAETKKAK